MYSNECEALKAFERYEKCKAVYQRLFASGCPLTRLTVLCDENLGGDGQRTARRLMEGK